MSRQRTLTNRASVAAACLAASLGAIAEPAAPLDLLRGGTNNAAPEQLVAACRDLAHTGGADAVPVLAGYLGNERLSHMARYALERIPDPAAGAALRTALERMQGPLRVGVIQSLGARRDREAVPALAALLAAAEEPVAAAAAIALGNIADAAAGKALAPRIASATPPRRATLADACLTCAERLLAAGDRDAALALYAAVAAADVPAHFALSSVRGSVLAGWPAQTAPLADLLRADAPARRALGLRLVRELPGPAVAATVAEVLARVSADDQVQLVEALADRAEPAAAGALRGACASAVPQVRTAALAALGSCGDPAALETLLAALRGAQTPPETAAVLASLQRLPLAETGRRLGAALPALPPAVRPAVLKVLAERNATDARDAVVAQAAESDPAIAEAAFKALGKLARPEDLPRLVALMLAAGTDGVREVARRSVVALALAQPDPSPRADAVAEALERAKSPAERILLMRTLGGIANYRAFVLLRAALDDAAPELRDAAVRALAAWPDATAAATLLDFAERTGDAVPRTLATRAAIGMAGLVAADSATLPAQVETWFRRIAALTKTPDDRKILLAQLGATPHATTLALAEAWLADAAISNEAANAVIRIATALGGAGAADPARRALERVLKENGDPALQGAAREALGRLRGFTEYMTSWQVCGPFAQDGKECQELYGIAFPPETAPDQAAWRSLVDSAVPNQSHLVRIDGTFPGNHRVAYARTRIVATAGQPARLECGFDDGGKVWLNGGVVCEANTAGACVPGGHKADVTLREGENLLFVKLTQHSGPWHFCARLVRPDGTPLTNVTVSTLSVQAATPAALAAAPETALRLGAPLALFNGRDLAGWEGDPACFRVADGAIVAGQLKTPIAKSDYLVTQREFGDFELTADVRLLGAGCNGGLQFWGQRKPGTHEMSGFQADACDGAYWGSIYDCNRNRMLVHAPPQGLAHVVRTGDWNEYRVRAAGGRLQLWLNGCLTAEWLETDATIPRRGRIGLQTHQGPPGEGRYRNLVIRDVLP